MEQIQLTQLSLDDLKNILDEVISEHLKDVKKEQPDQLFTRKELAERLSISLPTLHKYSQQGILISYKIGNRIYYRWSEVLKAAIQIESTQV